nr:F0F1 ATP synthase subunit A [uncultured Macellibacteroides sp.]
MKQIVLFFRKIAFVLVLFFIGISQISASDVKVGEMVFSHIKDSYEWHITKWNDTEISLPLPVIVFSQEKGLNVFLSSKLRGGVVYKGFYKAVSGVNEGKVVEKNKTGQEIRPFDISITKTVLALLISCFLLAFIILKVARWYRKRPLEVPGGFVGMMEMLILGVNDGVIKENIGSGYKHYAPYLLTVFFFILVNNLMGLIPIFPGGANVTGNIVIPFVLALCTFLIVTFSGTKFYWKEIVWPDTPLFLKVPIPLMPFVNVFEVFTKPFSLMIRLFANVMAGHTIVLGFISLVFITVSMGIAVNATMTLVSVVFTVFMNLVELLVSCIQAYIFTLLSAVYIGQARVKG